MSCTQRRPLAVVTVMHSLWAQTEIWVWKVEEQVCLRSTGFILVRALDDAQEVTKTLIALGLQEDCFQHLEYN
eukprot:102738-Pelagomonas_calceolata.AAC.1